MKTSTFFKDNTQILTKVYFPRLLIPLSLIITNFAKFCIQFLLFIIVYIYFLAKGTSIHINSFVFLFPVLVAITALLGLGAGMIVSSLSIRYKDLIHLLSFGVQLMMFTSSVVFPLSSFADSKYKWLIMANPMTGVIEAFRYGFLGRGYLSWPLLIYDSVCTVVLLLIGLIIFNTIEKNFTDSI